MKVGKPGRLVCGGRCVLCSVVVVVVVVIVVRGNNIEQNRAYCCMARHFGVVLSGKCGLLVVTCMMIKKEKLER